MSQESLSSKKFNFLSSEEKLFAKANRTLVDNVEEPQAVITKKTDEFHASRASLKESRKLEVKSKQNSNKKKESDDGESTFNLFINKNNTPFSFGKNMRLLQASLPNKEDQLSEKKVGRDTNYPEKHMNQYIDNHKINLKENQNKVKTETAENSLQKGCKVYDIDFATEVQNLKQHLIEFFVADLDKERLIKDIKDKIRLSNSVIKENINDHEDHHYYHIEKADVVPNAKIQSALIIEHFPQTSDHKIKTLNKLQISNGSENTETTQSIFVKSSKEKIKLHNGNNFPVKSVNERNEVFNSFNPLKESKVTFLCNFGYSYIFRHENQCSTSISYSVFNTEAMVVCEDNNKSGAKGMKKVMLKPLIVLTKSFFYF